MLSHTPEQKLIKVLQEVESGSVLVGVWLNCGKSLQSCYGKLNFGSNSYELVLDDSGGNMANKVVNYI